MYECCCKSCTCEVGKVSCGHLFKLDETNNGLSLTRPSIASAHGSTHHCTRATTATMTDTVVEGATEGKQENGSSSPTERHDESVGEEEALKDRWCDPEHPTTVTFQDISAAAYMIKNGIQRTPCTKSNVSRIAKMDIYFKKEFLQFTGSFKERGARYTLMMLSPAQKKLGVVAASAGNHALALAYHGKDLNIPVYVVMPIIAPLMKIENCKTYGANIIVRGAHLGESKEIALKIAKEKGYEYINGYDHPHIIAGAGTMGLEIVEQVSDIDAVVIPIGGAGLIAGSSIAIKSLYPDIQIIGVEAESCPCYTTAVAADHPIYAAPSSTLADGLSVPIVGVNAFATARGHVDKTVVVSEEWVAVTILRLIEMEKAVVEGAGAVGLAAVLSGKLPELVGKRVVIALTGGNIDTTVLGRCLERGLAVDERLVRFSVTVADRPGGIAELTQLLAKMGASLKDIFHERAWLRADIFSVNVKCVIETKDREHAQEVERALHARYTDIKWGGDVSMGRSLFSH
ncbi:PREDICTED: L-threonine dehydratase catabolic TdcB-like [Priapulus caudatus]|uniref:L-serine deaminase n=1 Tax=Priapulus caudatus TaxID=37621 RepID=A0ABM1EMJ9_PRICU|nr:PREDICTED: L-threonine dehydratase catabolic TdcB-like [Priapulus caudatus]